MNTGLRFRRRDVLAPILFLGLAGGSGVAASAAPIRPFARPNRIQIENLAPGDTSWRMIRPGGDGDIVGYPSAVSVTKGDRLDFMVSVTPAQRYSITIYRMGWYGGAGGRRVATLVGLAGAPQPPARIDPQTRMIFCQWSPSASITIPAAWTDGVYIAKLTSQSGFEHCMRFVVRDDARAASYLYQQPAFTYQAYNLFPGVRANGKNLYWGFDHGKKYYQERSLQVSFDRPYSIDDSTWQYGPGLNWETSWERPFVNWAERMGLDVTYSTDLDTHLRPWRLTQYEGIISAGHNEYWTVEMMDAWIRARDRGVNLAFLGSNAAYWRVLLSPASDGRPNRAVLCAKDPAIDRQTIRFRDLGRAEQQLVGVQYSNSAFPQMADFEVKNTRHWAFAGTGLKDGDRIRGILGYEVDSLQRSYPQPRTSNYTVLGSSPFFGALSNASLYQAPSGAWVFATGTLGWAYGLDHPALTDPRIQRITSNVLAAFLKV